MSELNRNFAGINQHNTTIMRKTKQNNNKRTIIRCSSVTMITRVACLLANKPKTLYKSTKKNKFENQAFHQYSNTHTHKKGENAPETLTSNFRLMTTISDYSRNTKPRVRVSQTKEVKSDVSFWEWLIEREGERLCWTRWVEWVLCLQRFCTKTLKHFGGG